MAIVKMKKLRLMAVRTDRDELLKELLRRGCVEISEPTELQTEELAPRLRRENGEQMAARSRLQSLQNALAILDRYAPGKAPLLSPKPEVEGEKLLDEQALEVALKTAETLHGNSDRIRRISAEESRLRSTIESLQPWKGLDLSLDCTQTRTSDVSLGSVPARIAQLFLLDILFRRLCLLDQERYSQNRQIIASALADKHL